MNKDLLLQYQIYFCIFISIFSLVISMFTLKDMHTIANYVNSSIEDNRFLNIKNTTHDHLKFNFSNDEYNNERFNFSIDYNES